ncbi:MAG: hypothetical protein JOZ90_03700 [Alphaproteobacteria bacterium]|nr:hypothetical protein [Alphaproteobacteria bacterium]MBV9372666.1 hypothetical protein [Alphaproteobacteria bacterium]MBV9900184.1 hypothetical protein [Alphaproteobacteria bacterium]
MNLSNLPAPFRPAALAALTVALAACDGGGGSAERGNPAASAPAKAAAPALARPAPARAQVQPQPQAKAGPRAAPAASPAPSSPCRSQDGRRLDLAALRATGTEPFWSAAIEGRCVTYSTPEDPTGERVWTLYAAGPGGAGAWAGALRGRPFVLRLRPEPGCSDGMSDRSYSFAAELLVGGERRRGCARPD